MTRDQIISNSQCPRRKLISVTLGEWRLRSVSTLSPSGQTSNGKCPIKKCKKESHERKAARTSHVIATKALACKLAKAAWYLAAEETDYEPGRVFGPQAGAAMKQ